MKTWKRRWFILTDSCLYYFEYTTVRPDTQGCGVGASICPVREPVLRAADPPPRSLGSFPSEGLRAVVWRHLQGHVCPLGESGLAEGAGVLELGLLVPWREATDWAVPLLNCRTRSPAASFPWRT